MFIRTFLRIMFNKIFCNNTIITALQKCINFCNKFGYLEGKLLKFSPKMPLDKIGTNEKISFRSITGDEIDYNNVKTC